MEGDEQGVRVSQLQAIVDPEAEGLSALASAQ
jgi:hypothetical protein